MRFPLNVVLLNPTCRLQVHRCRQSISFSLQCAWLLGAYSSDMHISTQRHSRGTKLRKLILSDELKPAGPRARRDPLTLTPFCPVTSPASGGEHSLSPSKRTHQRSKSDATVSISLSSNLKRTASNPKVESSQDEVSAPGSQRFAGPGSGSGPGPGTSLCLVVVLGHHTAGLRVGGYY